MKNRKKKPQRAKKGEEAAVPMPSPAPLSSVLRAISREQTRALIYEHAAEYVSSMFGVNEVRSDPKKVLMMPDGSRRPADLLDVVEIVTELERSAYEARGRMRRLREAGVLVDQEALVHDDIPYGPRPSPPPGEGVADAGGGLLGDTPDRRRERQADGLRRGR